MTSLTEVLERQRARGVLGADQVTQLRTHSRGFATALGAVPDRALDLGSGGGVPGLVLAAERWPSTDLVLLDASQRRCTYLELAVTQLGLPRVVVRWARAEAAGRDEALRGRLDAVVARSFGPPAVVAECAAPLLAVGGALAVSEPPEGADRRWDETALARLGLEHEVSDRIDGSWFTRLRQVRPCPNIYPRRVGLPTRRPLF